jgi:hypothetical protein
MTTTRKIIESIDLEKYGESVDGSEDLPAIFGIYDYVPFDDRLKMVFVRPHYCTDSWVGVRAYYLDGEFVALSTQKGRKYDEEFQFVSNEAAMKVKDYVISFVEPQYDIKIADKLDEEIDDFYTVEYSEQILHKHGIHGGERVEIKRKKRKWDDFHTATIVGKDGKDRDVDCRDILLAYGDLS